MSNNDRREIWIPPGGKRPLHQRVGALGWFRARLRKQFFGLIRRAAGSDDGKAIQVAGLRNLLPPRASEKFACSVDQQPYTDLGQAPTAITATDRDDVVIVTARFRTGSTLLWQLFRAMPGFTAYYEPLNERRWFDSASRGEQVDATHRGVTDYWREYVGLEELKEYYRESWIANDLLMTEDAWDPDLKRYVELLIDRAAGRPVLQFNRIDFRLPWFHRHFPKAKILHLYRHPRDQWISSLVDPTRTSPTTTLAQFREHDQYYLLSWARELSHHYPFLDESQVDHPYELFYLIWKLSYLHGRTHAHSSLAYEDLLREPARQLSDMARTLNLTGIDIDALIPLVEKPRPSRWRSYASIDWFQEKESRCERVLADFFGECVQPQAVNFE